MDFDQGIAKLLQETRRQQCVKAYILLMLIKTTQKNSRRVII